jgi:transposase
MTDATLPATRSFRNEPRRRFSREYKRQVVETVLASPSSLARVAREHDLNHNQLSRWRREYQRGLYDLPNASPRLLPVCIDSTSEVATVPPAAAPVMSPALELHLPKGKVVIRAALLAPLLRQVIEAMQ